MFEVNNRETGKGNSLYQEPPSHECCAQRKAGPNQDNLGEKTVEYANEKISKAKPWFIVAIVVGSLVVIGVGGFGVLGLLQIHGVVALPQWLASAIGTVGSTPQAWGLWVMGVGGIVVGGGLVTFGSVRTHQIRKAERLQNFKYLNNNSDKVNRAEPFPKKTIFDNVILEKN